MDTLQSIENLPSESESVPNEEAHLLDFRFQARNISVDWRRLSLIDIDRIADTMDIEQLQEYIELVTFANLDELTNIDPLFVKLFRLSQFTIEYLLHSQDYLKLLISKETEKISKRDKKIKNSDSELTKLRNEIVQLKKENKKRRRIVEEQQRMMEVGANSFYKCPICPSKTFINATYLQGHMHRKHQDHTTYIGDAILHTKAVTQNLEEKLITVQDRIELEKRRNEDLIKKNQEEQKRAEEKILEQQEHIQRLERTRYENKLKELEQSFNNEVDQMKKQEKRYVGRINELEEKAEKHKKTESIVKSLKHDIPKIEDNVYLKLSEMENSFRHQQQLSEEAAKRREEDMIRRQPKTIQKSPKKKHLEFREDPVDLVAQDEERRRRFEELKEQFRPSMVRLLHSELEKLGIGLTQDGLTDNMFKIKMEQLRNNRAGKISSRPNFHDYRHQIELNLHTRSEEKINEMNSSMESRPKRPSNPPKIHGPDTSFRSNRSPSKPDRPMGPPKASPKRKKPTRPINPPTQSSQKPQWSELNSSSSNSPGKPHLASTMKKGSVEIQSSSDWDAPSEQKKQPKAMSEFKEQVIESVDAHSTITEKTEEDQTSAWDSEDPSEIESIGQGVKSKAEKLEDKLAARTGEKPVGGIDLSGVHDQTNMAVDELFDGESELSN